MEGKTQETAAAKAGMSVQFSAQVAERPIAVAGETGASVAHSAGSLRRGVGG